MSRSRTKKSSTKSRSHSRSFVGKRAHPLRTGAVAVVLGGAFSAGLVFGQARGQSEGGAELHPVAGDVLAIADTRTDQYEAVRQKLRLTFHQELTAAAAKLDPEPAAEEAHKTRENNEMQAVSHVTHKPEGKPASPAEATKAPSAAKAPEKASEAAKVAEAQPAAAPKAQAPSAEPDAGRDARIAAALSKVADAAPVAAKAPPAAIEVTSEKSVNSSEEKAYDLQVVSLPTEAAASELASRLRASGRAVKVEEASVNGQGAVFRVLVVGLKGREAADRAASQVEAELGLKGLVRLAK